MKKLFTLFIFILFSGNCFGNIDSLLLAAKKTGNSDTTLVHIYTQLGWDYLAKNDTANSAQYLRNSLSLAEQLKFDKGVINGNSNLAMYYLRMGHSATAIMYLSAALEKANATGDVNSVWKANINIAGAYLGQANYEEAVQYYLRAMQYLDKINDPTKFTINYHCLGITYYMLKNYPLSLRYYNKSMEVGVKAGKPNDAGYNLNGIGVVYKAMKLYDSALYYLDQAYTAAEKNKDNYLLAHNLSDKGEVYDLLGRRTEALYCLQRALELQVQKADQRGFAESCILLGDVYLNSKDLQQAKKYYDSARSIAVRVGAKDVAKNAWKGLAEVYRQMNNNAAALEAFQNYALLKDTLYTEESSKQIAEMQTRYNTEKKEKENILLQKENAVKGLQLTKEKSREYILICTFIFAVIISVIYYNRYRLKKKNEMLREREMRAHAIFMAQEDEKARLSKELHDSVGAVLSLIKLNISSITTPDATNQKILDSTKSLATNAIREVRNISHDLMPNVLQKAGLQAALEEMIESVSASGAIDISLSYTLPGRLPAEMERNIFRIVQEATNNIIRHAAATKEEINIGSESGRLLIVISDNGTGFDKNILSKITGNGLNNIFSRINAMKGDVEIETSLGNGARINITIPYQHAI
jgi:two-component system NarL family sensor kinase